MAAPPQQDARSVAAVVGSTSALPLRPPMRPTLRREWLLLTLSILIFAAVILPPLINLGRYQHRVADTMSRSLGRPVSMRRVTLRLLPTPALILADVVVHEQPGYGAEPILLAPALTAELRLSSLWRGRFEVSRVEMSEASLNLVRNADGSWNIGSVLLQASHVANAPTAQRRAGPAPRFPYIAITDSRVNLKQGVEKLPYTLLNANLSMWLAQPEVWQLKLEAQPVRTDLALGLADTGLLQVEGQLHRAAAVEGGGLGHLPLTLHAEWINAPLGQASRLLFGHDDGWRGELHLAADLTGEVDNLAVQTHLGIANLHREEFAPAEPFSVDATCRTLYRRQARTLDDLVCRWPVGAGQLLLRGSLAHGNLTGGGAPSGGLAGAGSTGTSGRLEIIADQLPANFLVSLASLMQTDAAPTARLEGFLTGSLIYTAQPGQASTYGGALESPSVQVTAPNLEEPLTLTRLRLAASVPGPTGAPTLVLSADPIALGGTMPVAANVQVTRQGLLVHAGGSASIARLSELGRATHLLPTAMARLAPQGTLDFDLTHSGSWQQDAPGSDFSALSSLNTPARSSERATRVPAGRVSSRSGVHPGFAPDSQPDAGSPLGTHGWLRLRNASYSPPFLSGSVTLPVAQANVLPGSVTWTVPSAVFHRLPLQATATYPLDCQPAQPCVTHFHLGFANLDMADLTTALLGSDPIPRPRTDSDSPAATHTLADLLSHLGSHTEGWPPLDGTLQADTLTLGALVLRQANATLSMQQREAHIEALDAKTLAGSLTGRGVLVMEGRTAHFTAETALHTVSAAALGNLFHENWGPGTITLGTHLQGTGLEAGELAASASGSFQAEWTRGSLGPQGNPLSQFSLWSATGTIASQTLTVAQGALTGATGQPSPVTGTIGFDRGLHLSIGTPPNQVTVTGTLAQPR